MDYPKLYGTLGPKACTESILVSMLQNGMDGMRLNLSHTELKTCESWIFALQNAGKKASIVPELLIDLKGPELRIGKLSSPLHLKTDETVSLSADQNKEDVPFIPIPESVLPYLVPGQTVLLDDGKISLKIKELKQNLILCQVITGGLLSSGKSIALPGIQIDMPTLTPDDLENLNHAKKYGVTGVMQPFVRGKEDLLVLKEELKKRALDEIQIFAKIENLRGVEILDEIIPFCDCIVIARGDLGNAVTLPKLPGIQKDISRKCREYHRSFMVVTQMLASMENSPVPTRAEVSDIFNAVLDGASSLMVTGETAVGKYPVETIRYLSETVKEAVIYRNRNVE